MKRITKALNRGRIAGWRQKLQRSLNMLVRVNLRQFGDEGPHQNPGWARCSRCSMRPKVLHRRYVGVILLEFCDLHLRMAEAGR